MHPHQQYRVQVKEEYDELGIWVPVKQERESAERLPGAFMKEEPTNHTTTIHNKPQKKKKAKPTEPLTKRENHVQRLETMNSLLRKDLREARDGITAQRLRDLETQVHLLQGVVGPDKTNILRDLKLENLQLQKRIDNVQREVDNAKRDIRAYNNGAEHKEDKAMIEALQNKLVQAKAQNESAAVRNLQKKLREEEVKSIRAEKRVRRADERLAYALGLMGHTDEEIVQYIEDDERLVEEQMRTDEASLVSEEIIKDEELMENE
ncbi:hypothetical protein J4E93_005732 [Alternaria ventricosa]|uniref:uncharacterized protein n=1 Tax=Alternaria ventricosa TaxID=1187951 RepID=UPI0020C22368|nr:uncharacterized protein J4E93_005732 [Alternaria ventricosa]KAI4644934.1 hypothetical protein J4E93_005732 [Alternaria ventricosa]